jgi:four helix bundle protein
MVKLYQHLSQEKREFVLSKQTLRAGTSIGANIEEANQAESRPDFIHKLAIANKEAFETHYWLRLLKDSEFLSEKLAQSLIDDCNELRRLLTSSIKTSKIKKIGIFHFQFSIINYEKQDCFSYRGVERNRRRSRN